MDAAKKAKYDVDEETDVEAQKNDIVEDIPSGQATSQQLTEQSSSRSADLATSIVLFDRKTDHLQLFNPNEKSVMEMHEVDENMKYGDTLSPVCIGNHLYVLQDKAMYRLAYCDAAAIWERMADPIAYHGWEPPSTVASGSIYVAGKSGGEVHGKFTRSASKYDPTLNRWEKLKDKHLATDDAAVVATTGHVYCIGGKAEDIEVTDRVERLDIVSQTWEEVAPLQQARTHASAIDCNGKIIVAGGMDDDVDILNASERYDPDLNQWTIMKSMTQPRSGMSSGFIDGNIYVVGGYDLSSNDLNSILKYDLEKDEWELFHDFGERMWICNSVAVKAPKSDSS